MDNLVNTIGPAPSELPLEIFIKTIKEERKRVNELMLQWREENLPKAKKAKATGKKRKAKVYDAVADLLGDLGTDRDSLLKLLEEKDG